MNRYRVRDKKNIWDSVPVDEVETIAIMLEDQNAIAVTGNNGSKESSTHLSTE